MIFHESMIIPSLYTGDEQAVIERWMRQVTVYPERDDLADANRVAELVLSSIQGQLPQGLSIQEDGSTVIERKTWVLPPVRMRSDLFCPMHLFDVDWAEDSFSEILWLESYYVTLLPGYNVYAVTFSQGSPSSYDYCDLAIGCFKVDEPGEIAGKAATIIEGWWQFQFNTWSQWAWREVVNPGLIDAGLACRMREEVWNNAVSVWSGNCTECMKSFPAGAFAEQH